MTILQLFSLLKVVIILAYTFSEVVVSENGAIDKVKYNQPATLPIQNHTNPDEVFFLPSLLEHGKKLLLHFPSNLQAIEDKKIIHNFCTEVAQEDFFCTRSWIEMF
ncbi:hypothetical protein AQUCO_09400034v1 [Aquilegia coerulea]|nr:hypothetical protein AQUCO_09400034v1 [Aquilegia coerulea]